MPQVIVRNSIEGVKEGGSEKQYKMMFIASLTKQQCKMSLLQAEIGSDKG